jgi:hypothetical protein
MPRRTFASQKELQDYAEQTGKVCRLQGFAKRQRLLTPSKARPASFEPSPDDVIVLYQRPGALAWPRGGDAQACRGYHDAAMRDTGIGSGVLSFPRQS